MKCKYCQTELQSNSSVCPNCGKDNLKDDLKVLKIVALSLVCVVMLVLLAGLVNYGVTGNFIPDWLTVSEEEKFEAAMDDVVATMGEHQMTNRQLQLYYWMNAYTYAEDADFTKPLSEQVYDKETGKTYEEYILEMAFEAWQEIMLLSDAAKEADFEMPEDYASQFDTMEEDLATMAAYYGIASVDALLQQQFGPGCDYTTYYNYAWDYYLGRLYWSEVMDGLEVTDQEINDYFTENEEALKNDYAISITKDFGNLVDFRNILIPVESTETTDEDGKKTTEVTEQNWADCLAKAEEVYNKWLEGDKTAESFGALAAEHSKDSGSNTAEGLYTDLYKNCLTEVDVRHILIIPEGGTKNADGTSTYTDEEWSAAMTVAQGILDQWLAGDKTEESFGELANEHSDDKNGAVTDGGIYQDVYLGQMVAEFEDWCFDASRQPGDYGIVKTVFGYHIMYFVRADREADNWVFDEARVAGDTAILKTDDGYQIIYYVTNEPAWIRYSRYGVQGEKSIAMLDELKEKNPVTINEKVIVLGEVTA